MLEAFIQFNKYNVGVCNFFFVNQHVQDETK